MRATLKPSDKAWMTMVAGIVAYELLAKDGELLSEASHRYCQAPGVKGWLVRAFIAATAGHLMGVVSHKYDLYYWDAKWFIPLRTAREVIRARALGGRGGSVEELAGVAIDAAIEAIE